MVDGTEPHTLLSSKRRDDIQGLRAIAVLMVVAFHAGLPVPGGYVGVDVFFVISGFVITTMLLREWTTTGRIRFRRFYFRRFKRLTPALALMVVVTMIISVVVLSPLGTQQTASSTAMGTMLLVGNLMIARTSGHYFDASANTNPLLNVWSLSVEEQFYLAFPAILAAGWFLADKSRRLQRIPYSLVALVCGTSLGVVLLTAGGWTPAREILGFYSPVSRAWEFAVGALVSLAMSTLSIASRNLAFVLGLLGIGMLTASLWLIRSTTTFPGPWTLLPVAGTVLLLLAGTHGSNMVSRMLATLPMVKVGDWSYSIYLWHWPFIVFATLIWPNNAGAMIAAALLACGPAVASYYRVEQPLRKLDRLSLRQVAQMVGGTLVPPLVLAGALWFAVQHEFWSPAVSSFADATRPRHTGTNAGCDTMLPQGERKAGECTWNESEPGAPVYLVGDSNADQFSEGVIRAAEVLHRPILVNTANSCPYLDIYSRRQGYPQTRDDKCRAYVRGSQEYLTSSSPGLVIIATTDEYWTDPDYAIGLTKQRATSNSLEKVKALQLGLTSIVLNLQNGGQTVMLVQTSPKWKGAHAWNPDHCSTLTIRAERCQQEMSVEQAMSKQGVVRQVLTSVSNSTGAEVLDSWVPLCPDRECSTQSGQLIRYRDESHISVAQSEALAPVFEAAIRDARQAR